jgi:hypothetical protein
MSLQQPQDAPAQGGIVTVLGEPGLPGVGGQVDGCFEQRAFEIQAHRCCSM